MKIIDSHHHLWDLEKLYYPWLTDRPPHHQFFDLSQIQRNFLLDDFLRAIGDLPLFKSVHIQANHDPDNPVAETEWLQAIADDPNNTRGFPNAIVADVNMQSARAEETMEDQLRFRNMRGIRMNPSPAASDPGTLVNYFDNAQVKKNIALLKKCGLSADVQVHPRQFNQLLPIIRKNSDVPFILCHLGLPSRPPQQGFEFWRNGLSEIATEPNAFMKLSGFGLWNHHWTAESAKELTSIIVEIFGADRCLFGSNWPVEQQDKDFNDMWMIFDQITMGYSESERSALFHDTAARLYRI